MTPEKEELLIRICKEIVEMKAEQKARGIDTHRFNFNNKPEWKALLTEKIIELKKEGLTDKKIVQLIPISITSVSKYSAGYNFATHNEELVSEGKKPIDINKFIEDNKLDKDIEKGLSVESRIKILSRIAGDDEKDAAIRISAVKALNDLATLNGESSRFLLEVGVNKKSMARYLSMLGIDKKQIVTLLSISDPEEIARKMEQLNGTKLCVLTTECFDKTQIDDRVIAKGNKDEEDEDEVNELNIEEISRGIDPVPLPKEKEVEVEENKEEEVAVTDDIFNMDKDEKDGSDPFDG